MEPVPTPAAPGAGGGSPPNPLALERDRVKKIRALCKQERASEELTNELIDSDSTYEQAAARLLEARRADNGRAPHISVGGDRAAEKPFATLGDQLVAIAEAGQGKASAETLGRLHHQAAVSGAGAGTGSDGGFAIQKDFSTDLMKETIESGNMLSRCDSHEVGPNADGLEVVYIDETSRATGSRWGGVQVYRGAEADSATAKKPKVGKWESRLEDIIGLAYMTERLLSDAPSMQNVFETAFADEFVFKVEDELVRGTGAGEMQGIITAACTVSITKETGQAADTLNAENIGKIWKSVHPRSRLRGAWFYNCELEDQLDQLQIGTGTSAQLVYMPPGGLSEAPYGRMKGRPVIPIEQASGAGDVGDFFFADWSRYKVITKGGLQSDNSIHVRFINNERTFRWITRINGAPKDKSSLTPYKRTDTSFKQSAFVVLGVR